MATPVTEPTSGDAAAAAGRTALVAQLATLPGSERRDALEALVVAEFKATMLMDADEYLPLDVSYFDLGLSSLGLTEIKQRLESVLGHTINANVLFNSPTVGRLMTHLTDEVMVGLFAEPAPAAAPSRTAAPDALWDDVLADLYRA